MKFNVGGDYTPTINPELQKSFTETANAQLQTGLAGQSGSGWVGESLELVGSIRRDWLKRPIFSLPIGDDLLLVANLLMVNLQFANICNVWAFISRTIHNFFKCFNCEHCTIFELHAYCHHLWCNSSHGPPATTRPPSLFHQVRLCSMGWRTWQHQAYVRSSTFCTQLTNLRHCKLV